MKNFSILIASWNNLDYLKLLLRSIEKNSCYDHEVIVHVQEGTDGTLEWCRENNILHTHSESNVGISQAVNNCFSKATKDWICHMDDDMYVCPEWDKKLLDFIHENKLGETAWVASTMIEPRGDNPLCITLYYFTEVYGKRWEEQMKNTSVPALKKVYLRTLGMQDVEPLFRHLIAECIIFKALQC